MSDYAGLVCIRALSRDIRRLLYYELLRCSGIHLDESALMTVQRDEAHPDNYCSSLIKQTTSGDLCLALSHSIIFIFFFLVFAFLYLLSSLPIDFWISLPSYFLPLFPLHLFCSSSSLLFNCHLPLAISVIQIPTISSVIGGCSGR